MPLLKCHWCDEEREDWAARGNMVNFALEWENYRGPPRSTIRAIMCYGCMLERGLLGLGFAMYYTDGSRLRVTHMSNVEDVEKPWERKAWFDM